MYIIYLSAYNKIEVIKYILKCIFLNYTICVLFIINLKEV